MENKYWYVVAVECWCSYSFLDSRTVIKTDDPDLATRKAEGIEAKIKENSAVYYDSDHFNAVKIYFEAKPRKEA